MLTYTDVTDLVRTTQELKKLATIDAMTGMYNRSHFLSLAEAEWTRFMRYHRSVSMLMIDIDHFKSVNDRYGHAAGDAAISAVAAICLESKRALDLPGRLGGEEFALLLPETGADEAALVAERLREKIQQAEISFGKERFSLTVSIGVAQGAYSMPGISAVLQAADKALYDAKAGGRNRIVQHVPSPQIHRIAAE
jgi:diguanylate cyclase (GGDEF)-like protein